MASKYIQVPGRVTLTKSKNTVAGVHYTTKHTGKMAGVVSVSTDINSNKFCQARRNIKGSICEHCFAAAMVDDKNGRYRSVNKCFKINTEILTSRVLAADEIPVIDPRYFPLVRLESIADLQNVIQFLNYAKMAEMNPGCLFALYTKNRGIVAKGLKLVNKPANMQIVFSSLFMNKESDAAGYDFIDKVFTVYDENTIKNQGIEINCGARSCFKCRRCYMPNPDGVKIQQIREKLK